MATWKHCSDQLKVISLIKGTMNSVGCMENYRARKGVAFSIASEYLDCKFCEFLRSCCRLKHQFGKCSAKRHEILTCIFSGESGGDF